ncbi:MAG: penicillin-binding protein activator [Pseudomonadota bacterium]
MNRFNTVFLVLFSFVTLTLAGCGGGGLNANSWVFSGQKETAERPPESLAEGLLTAQTGEEDSADKLNEKLKQPEATIEREQLYDGVSASSSSFDNRISLSAPTETVKVALLLPLSGQHASLGQAMQNAAQLAMFDLGQSRFELLPRDTKGTPQGAAEAAEAALDEGAKLIIGPLFASSLKAVRSEVGRSVNIISFSTDWSLAGGNTFLMGFLPFDQVERLAQFVAYKGVENVGIYAPDTDYGRVVTTAYQRVAPYFEIPPADAKFFESDSTNLAPDIRAFTQYDDRIAQSDLEAVERFQGIEDPKMIDALKRVSEPINVPLPYDAVLLPMGGELVRNVANLLSHFDMPPSKVRRLGTGLLDDPGLASEQSLDGAWFAAPSPKLRASFEGRYSELYGSEPPRLTTLAYDATALAIILARNSIREDGDVDFSRRAIMNPNGFSGIDGIFRFRSNGTVERGLAVLEFRRGRIRVLDEAPRTFQRPQS